MNKKEKILVLDDDPDIGTMIKMMLEYKGYSVTVSDRGARVAQDARRDRRARQRPRGRSARPRHVRRRQRPFAPRPRARPRPAICRRGVRASSRRAPRFQTTCRKRFSSGGTGAFNHRQNTPAALAGPFFIAQAAYPGLARTLFQSIAERMSDQRLHAEQRPERSVALGRSKRTRPT